MRYSQNMRKVIVLCLGIVVFSSQLRAHEMGYTTCAHKDAGCYIGRYSAGAGLGWSRFQEATSFWPHVEFELGTLDFLSVDLVLGGVNSRVIYKSLSAAPSLTVGGGVKFYPRGLYRGFVLRGAVQAHLYRQDLSNQRYTSQTAVLSTVGWRWRPRDSAGSFIIGAGAQRQLSRGATIQPLVETQIAVDFNLDSIFF